MSFSKHKSFVCWAQFWKALEKSFLVVCFLFHRTRSANLHLDKNKYLIGGSVNETNIFWGGGEGIIKLQYHNNKWAHLGYKNLVICELFRSFRVELIVVSMMIDLFFWLIWLIFYLSVWCVIKMKELRKCHILRNPRYWSSTRGRAVPAFTVMEPS